MPLPQEYLELVKKVNARPQTWDDVVGNARAISMIHEAITAAKKNKTRLDHLLLYGSPGTGKTTLARIIAADVGGAVEMTTASTLETAADVIRVLYRMNTPAIKQVFPRYSSSTKSTCSARRAGAARPWTRKASSHSSKTGDSTTT